MEQYEDGAVYLGDCLDIMPALPPKSVDLILCDLPYGTTRSKWDSIINLICLWQNYNNVIKDKGAIVLTASQPFTSTLIVSNPDMFKYEWIWEKSRGSNFIHSKFQPLKTHESILVFSKSPAAYTKNKNQMNYYPQMTKGVPYDKGIVENDWSPLQGEYKKFSGKNETGKRYPRSVLYFSSDSDKSERGLHPTQKPVELFEYLIKTYTKEGDCVLDSCAGSGTTAIAAIKNNRRFLLIEKEEKYYQTTNKRIKKWKNTLSE